MINSFVCAKQTIRAVISKSSVPEDPIHAESVLWYSLYIIT